MSAISSVNITAVTWKNRHLGLRSSILTLIKMTVSNLCLFLLRWNQMVSQLSLYCVKPSLYQTLGGTDIRALPEGV